MPTISTQQQDAIRDGYTRGLTDAATAAHAGVSLSTVKRYRRQFGLPTLHPNRRLGNQGEQLLADLALARGLTVEWRLKENAAYDLVIEGLLIDVKTTAMTADGLWKFHLPRQRRSFYGSYVYPKNYGTDCDVIALVCLHHSEEPDVYFLPSAQVPAYVQIRPGDGLYQSRNNWFSVTPSVIAA